VTLVLACVFMAVWIRSTNDLDDFAVRFSNQRGVIFGTEDCGFYVKRYTSQDPDVLEEPPEDRFEFWTTPTSTLDPQSEGLWNPGCWRISSDQKFCGFRYARFGGNAVEILLIPCWSIVLPLTLLSAYLILWKPRKKPEDTPHA
jgi:hypothetical protein